jgi:hypothetical protein
VAWSKVVDGNMVRVFLRGSASPDIAVYAAAAAIAAVAAAAAVQRLRWLVFRW